MNTNHLKKFAQEARRKLLEQVGAKLHFVLTTDSAELREKTEQLKQLRQELDRTSKEQLVEKVAYTWFNRLMALRFMDANDYQPLGIRIITPKNGYTIPELLDEAKRGNIPDELKVNRHKIYDLLDNRIPSKNPQNEAFKELLIAACNYLSTTFPFLFEKINDYTELLLPDDLTSDFSIVKDVQDGILSEDCINVEIIGWLYQFYISEEKERLINARRKYKAHEIAPVTQLFTPKWIVQYMVDNTLGQLWKEVRPKTNVIKDLEFYIKPENEDIIPKRQLKSPEEISFFDPCVGSAHILCYAFDLFFKIYQEEGYNEAEIPEFILTKNLFGADIDERAAQLSGFALMMKGLQFNRRFLKKGIIPNIIAYKNYNGHPKFRNAELFGSLIKIKQQEADDFVIDENSIFSEQQRQFKRQISFLTRQYDILVTNPPYLNSTNMEEDLKHYIEENYSNTKSDLFACFLDRACSLAKEHGFIGYLSPYVWMFNSSYEKLRKFLIYNTTISTLVQLEYNAFEPACVPIATFTIRNGYLNNFKGSYIRLSDFRGHLTQAPKTLEAIKNPNCGWFYHARQEDFNKIAGCPIGYWVSEKYFGLFAKGITLNKIASPRQGIATSNNERFLRYWHEVSRSSFFLGCSNEKESNSDIRKWYPYNKGGVFRKWYGNNEYVINWQYNGRELRNFKPAVIRNPRYFFREGITWTSLTSGIFNARYSTIGYLFDSKGPVLFPEENKYKVVDCYYLLALVNSNVINSFLEILSPTLDYNQGPVGNIVLPPNIEPQVTSDLCKSCVDISREEWDSRENSWDFNQNSLIFRNGSDIEEAIDLYQLYWKNKFFQLHKNEVYINKLFVELYELQKEISPEVPLNEISILDKESLINGEQLTFKYEEIFAQFLNYAVGCMFGRFSLDKNGFIITNHGETIQDYLFKISKSENGCTFMPDKDNIIPLLDDNWFEDDIVGKFYRFLKVTFGEKNFNKNLAFIEEHIGKDIRNYFIRDFYPDHIKRYRKRPIYWMFSSPKGSFNVLIYMHRYTPDTVSNILNKYLKEFIGKLNTRKEHLEHVQVTGSASDKNKAIKEIDSIVKTLAELHEYERDILHPLATDRIEIDLDDGVLVNYNKFGKAVKEVNGLNDPATKKKVKQFDWINTSQIR